MSASCLSGLISSSVMSRARSTRSVSNAPSAPARAATASASQRPSYGGARHRLSDSSLRLNPRAGCRFGLERTGERMLGTAQRHADEKT
jgi:hypothetical protein